MKLTRVLAVVLAALALVAAGCGGDDEGVPEGAVAVVDGQTIGRTELDALIARVRKTYEGQKRQFPKAGSPEYQSLQSQAVAFLVQRIEFEKEASELGVKVTDEQIDSRVAQLKKQFFKNDQKTFTKGLSRQGYTVESFKTDVRAQILSEKLYEKVTGDVNVTAADVQRQYQKNKEQYTTPETREVRHILVKTKAEANAIYDQLKRGADFTRLALQKSLDPGSKSNGGKLTISRGQTVPPFDQTAFLLPTNSLSRPIKTEFGFHLIQPLGEVKPAKTTPFAQVKDTIKSQLEQERKQSAVTKWSQDVKKEYEDKVEYAEAYKPPAAATETSAGTTG
jgi:parvulin-like peptidyl-prolyl isomerase